MGTLQTGKVLVLSTLAGLLAGGVFVGINLGLVQRYNTALADTELENLFAAGEFDEQEFDIQMRSIYFSQLYGSIIIGLAAGTLVGGTFIAAKISIMSPLRKALLIAGIAWFVLYVIPTVKYPPSPTAMFDPEVAGIYQELLAGHCNSLAHLGNHPAVITLTARTVGQLAQKSVQLSPAMPALSQAFPPLHASLLGAC